MGRCELPIRDALAVGRIYASAGGRNQRSTLRCGSARFGGEAEVLADGRRNATTMFHRLSAFDHLPVAINVFIQHLLFAGPTT